MVSSYITIDCTRSPSCMYLLMRNVQWCHPISQLISCVSQGMYLIMRNVQWCHPISQLISHVCHKICICWDFIWDGKTNQISRNVCSLPQNKGGMGMVNLNHFIQAKQVKCMHNIIHSELDKWNVIGKYWLTSMDSKFETDLFSL